jgi:8-hydroxy-5-deazaflavin:NADPH oxidoreductase
VRAASLGSSDNPTNDGEEIVKVTIIGAGNMARGIGTRVLEGGNELELVARNREAAEALTRELGGGSVGDSPSGEAVVLAVPYGAVADVVSDHGDALRGKVVVDITNPVDWSTFDGLVTPSDSSAAEEIAKLLPDGTPVVKAFNTTFAPTVAEGKVAGEQLDVLLAGDDADAKEKVASFVEAGGLRPLDIGPLKRSRQLEQLGFLHITAQEPLGAGFGSAVKINW